MHQLMLDYLESLKRDGRYGMATSYELGLKNLWAWLQTRSKGRPSEPADLTASDLETFQKYLASDYRSPDSKRLAKTTQSTRLAAVKSFYRWLHDRGLIYGDPAAELKLPKIGSKGVAMDFLSQQEATAMLNAQSAKVAAQKKGTIRWALALRDLALLSVALASGRRRTSLKELKVRDMDFRRNEIRIEWEKGKTGRVLPIAQWAMDVAQKYLTQARPIILNGRADVGWLWPARDIDRISATHLRELVLKVKAMAVLQNPDLTELASKRLGTHGLRVTYAKMLFDSGADLRGVNELLLHSKLSTTARYVPLQTSDMRRALRQAHPRA